MGKFDSMRTMDREGREGRDEHKHLERTVSYEYGRRRGLLDGCRDLTFKVGAYRAGISNDTTGAQRHRACILIFYERFGRRT